MTTPLPQPHKGDDWTIETLRQHVAELMNAADRRYQERFEAQAAAIAAALASANRIADQLGTTGTLREEVARIAGAVRAMSDLTEAKFVTFRVLVDSEAEKVKLALDSADKAVTKAEMANEKRFEGVNEFRAQLGDQARTFMPRAESEARHAQNSEKLADLTSRVADLDKRHAQSLSRNVGHSDSTRNMVTIITVIIMMVGVAVSIIVATR